MNDTFSAMGSGRRNQWQVSAKQCNLVRASGIAKPTALSSLPKDIVIDLACTALLVIDMQNDFCHPQGWLASIGVDITAALQPIKPLQAALPVLRGAGVPIVWLNWGNRPDRLNLSPSALHVYNGDGRSVGLGDALPGAPCDASQNNVLQAGSWGAAVVADLVKAPTDISIDKYRMSGFHDTCLDSVLRNMDIKTILFSGVNADQCVLATLMDANFAGYDCVLLEDCTSTTSPAFCWEATLYNVRQCFGFTALSKDLLP